MIARIFAKSREQMSALVHNHPELIDSHCFISIVGGSGQHLFAADTERVMTLEFDDVKLAEVAASTQEERSRFVIFNTSHADKVIDFLLANHQRPGKECLLLHCMLGVFRSGAVASFACDLLGLDRVRFAKDNPRIVPNDLVAQTLQTRWRERSDLHALPRVAC